MIESASEFFSGRLTKKERKATLAEELLSDGTFHQYRYVLFAMHCTILIMQTSYCSCTFFFFLSVRKLIRLSEVQKLSCKSIYLLLKISLPCYLPIWCRKRKVREIEEHNRPAGVDKWKRSKSKKHGKSNGKKRRH